MSRIAIAALLLLADQPALAADPPWRAAWYQVEMFPAVQIGGTPYDDKAACERDLKTSTETIVRCARIAKPADALDAAIAMFAGVIKEQPQNAPVIMQLGNLYMQHGDTAGAIASYTRAMELTPDDFWPYVLRASAYQKIGKRDEAITDYHAAIARHPDANTLKQAQDALKDLGAPS